MIALFFLASILVSVFLFYVLPFWALLLLIGLYLLGVVISIIRAPVIHDVSSL